MRIRGRVGSETPLSVVRLELQQNSIYGAELLDALLLFKILTCLNLICEMHPSETLHCSLIRVKVRLFTLPNKI